MNYTARPLVNVLVTMRNLLRVQELAETNGDGEDGGTRANVWAAAGSGNPAGLHS